MVLDGGAGDPDARSDPWWIGRSSHRGGKAIAPTGAVPIGAETRDLRMIQGQVTVKSKVFTPTGTYTLCDAPPPTVHPAATPVSATV